MTIHEITRNLTKQAADWWADSKGAFVEVVGPSILTKYFALRAQWGRDARAPSKGVDSFIPK